MHCDLKKNNVLCDADQQTGAVRTYITDFGVSQMMLGAEKVQSRVNVRLKALSVCYASPEVLTAFISSDVDGKTSTVIDLTTARSKASALGVVEAHGSRDVYALGILMWECLHRVNAWTSRSFEEVYQLVVVEKKRPYSNASYNYELACRSFGK